MSSFYLSRIAEGIHAVARAIRLGANAMIRLAEVEEKKLSAREEHLSQLTPAERLHENGLSSKDWVLDKDQQPELAKKPGDEDE